MAKVGRNKNANISLFSLILQTTILLAEHIQSYATSRMLLYHVTKGVAVKNITKPLKVATKKKKKNCLKLPLLQFILTILSGESLSALWKTNSKTIFSVFFFFFSDFSRMKSAKTSFVKLFPLV